MPLVADWNAYAPEPVLVKNPVLANPLILSTQVPLAAAQLVPPDATPIGVDAVIVVPTTAPFQPVDNMLPALVAATEKPIPGFAQYSPVVVAPVNSYVGKRDVPAAFCIKPDAVKLTTGNVCALATV